MNLRIVSASNNVINQTLRSDNKSGVTGVCWFKRRGRWEAYIKVNKKKVNLGYFYKLEDAIVARLKAVKKHDGEYSPQKHLFELYGV
jgi:hypothetical protein